jgi:hypothetical protein
MLSIYNIYQVDDFFYALAEPKMRREDIALFWHLGTSLGSEQACLRAGEPANLGERLVTNCQKQGMCSTANCAPVSNPIPL